MLDSNADLSARNQIRAPRVDVVVPAQKLAHGELVLVSRDNVPAGVSITNSIELVT